MSKVLVCRQSGYPVENVDAEAFVAEYKDNFDLLEKEHGKDMLKFQEALSKVEKELAAKYKTIAEWDFISDNEGFKKAIDTYGSILVSTHIETGEIMYVIMDQGL